MLAEVLSARHNGASSRELISLPEKELLNEDRLLVSDCSHSRDASLLFLQTQVMPTKSNELRQQTVSAKVTPKAVADRQ